MYIPRITYRILPAWTKDALVLFLWYESTSNDHRRITFFASLSCVSAFHLFHAFMSTYSVPGPLLKALHLSYSSYFPPSHSFF